MKNTEFSSSSLEVSPGSGRLDCVGTKGAYSRFGKASFNIIDIRNHLTIVFVVTITFSTSSGHGCARFKFDDIFSRRRSDSPEVKQSEADLGSTRCLTVRRGVLIKI